MIAERDEDFEPFKDAMVSIEGDEEPVWPASQLQELLGYASETAHFTKALNLAKVAAAKSGISIRENFVVGDLLSDPGETFLTKFAAILVVMNADPNKHGVALAQTYFALQCDHSALEDERRIQTRLQVNDETRKLQGAAKSVGVTNYGKFMGKGYEGLYQMTLAQIRQRKGLTKSQQLMDFAGSEELAANLFRITQTRAALKRQSVSSERLACTTHKAVGGAVRRVITGAGNTPPEALPVADTNVGRVVTQVKRRLKST